MEDTTFKIVFFGTSEFAVPSLEALAKDGRFEIVCVVTQPDRPVGRHATLTPPPIKQAATDLGITTILQPEKIVELKDALPAADAHIVVSYGKILPQWLLDLPKQGILNVHGSLLPRWRGASPIQAAIAAGDATSGVTIMQIDAELDHGPILAQADEPISATDTGGDLHDRLALLGAQLLPMTLAGFLEGTIKPLDQDHDLATFCKTLSRDDGKLDFNKTSEELECLIRAYNPWPSTWMDVDGQRLKIHAARVSQNTDTKKPGERFVLDHAPCIACADGTSLELLEVQLEGKSRTDGKSFLTGYAKWIETAAN